MIPPNYLSAKLKLDEFIEQGLKDYSKRRNFDNGPENRSNVSCLSPFIKRRILHEREVITSCLKKYNFQLIEKFIQEVFWRTYWKGWLESRPEVWKDYIENLNTLKKDLNGSNIEKDYEKAVNSRTGIECFDFWSNELTKTGYLHNHSRMWFASIWIFTLNLPWELGADFFYKNLLDADAASNTLSWRWVSGLHTKDKVYLAREENIEKFSKFRFRDKQILAKRYNTKEYKFYEYSECSFSNEKFDNIDFYLINQNNLIYDESLLKKLEKSKFLYLNLLQYSGNSKIKQDFESSAVKEYLNWLKENQIEVKIINNEDELNSFVNGSELLTAYPSIGYEKDKLSELKKQNKINLKYLYDSYDLLCWPHAKSGFFKFKNKISDFIKAI